MKKEPKTFTLDPDVIEALKIKSDLACRKPSDYLNLELRKLFELDEVAQ